MNTVTVNASKTYDIRIGSGILADCGEEIIKLHPKCKAALITDSTVDPLYSKKVSDSLSSVGFEVVKHVFKSGESSKNLTTYGNILEFLAENALTRTDIIIALGGGVTGDMAGFAAATYLRGIAFVQIPTTFLAMIDSSVGGKTAVNLAAGKNLVGTFYQPDLVLCDTDTLSSLPEDVFADGTAEAIKYGVIYDESLFELIAKNDIHSNLQKIITGCVEIKAKIVSKDERDNGLRQILNFGHTIGHAIEKCSGYEITHGHAVAIGMAMISRSACKAGLFSENCREAVLSALRKHNLPENCSFSTESLAEKALSDKKRRGSEITLIIPEKIGTCKLHKMDVKNLKAFIEEGRK